MLAASHLYAAIGAYEQSKFAPAGAACAPHGQILVAARMGGLVHAVTAFTGIADGTHESGIAQPRVHILQPLLMLTILRNRDLSNLGFRLAVIAARNQHGRGD